MSNNKQKSIFEHSLSPYLQGIIAFGMLIVFLFFGKIMSWIGGGTFGDDFPWTTAGTFMLVFAIFNSIFLFKADNHQKYWQESIFAYLGLSLLSMGLAYLITMKSMDSVGTYRWIYFMLTMGYLVFFSIVLFIKKLMSIVQHEDEKLHH